MKRRRQSWKEERRVNNKKRVVTSILLAAFFGALFVLDFFTGIPAVPIAISIIAIMCFVEIITLCQRQLGVRALWAVALQLVIVIAACVFVWIIEIFFEDWLIIALSLAVPVVAQNISAYFIGRYLLPKISKDHSPIHQFLNWHHFKLSPKKTMGVTITTSLIALVVAVPFAIFGPLYFSVTVISSFGAAIGDYLESRLKRLTYVKDSGEKLRQGTSIFAMLERALASHGGLLDRFDSLLFCAAVSLIPIIIFLIY